MAKRKPVAKSLKKIVAYCPPPREVIDAYARDVCEQLGQKLDPVYGTHEMQHEIAGFLKVVATVCAKQLTKQNGANEQLDKEKQQE